MATFHDDLTSARWLPRTVVRPWLLPVYRLMERLAGWLPGERVRLEGGGEALIFRPKAAPTEPAPGVLWIHGGGLVIGHAAFDAALCQQLADALGAVVVSAHYRLAPEHPFPTPVEDCFGALQALAALPDVTS